MRDLRVALLKPFVEWAESAAAKGKDGAAPFPLGGLTWRRLRLRDAQAGCNSSILRDEKTLKAALVGFSDGRQVAIQVLDFEENLEPEDVVFVVYPWLVQAQRLLGTSEIVVSKLKTLEEVREILAARFKMLLENDPEEEKPQICIEEEGEEASNVLELAALYSPQGIVQIKHCWSLKWSDVRLNPSKAEALAKTLTDVREIRDGVVLIMRYKLDVLRGAPRPPTVTGGKGAGKAKAQGFTSIDQAAASIGGAARSKAAKAKRPERGIHIEVACPDAEVQEKNLASGGTDTRPAASGESAR